jgi:ubiquinone/menaquinone biosynthesis C-methylase UbiE
MTGPATRNYDDIAAEYDAAFTWESDPDVIVPVWNHLGRPLRVVEFACGPARLLSTLVAAGAFGVGVDVSGPMLDLAREHLEATGGAFALAQASLEEFTTDEAYGGAFCAVGSFGHLRNDEAALAHLTKVRDCMADGGRYAIQLSLKPLIRTETQILDASMGWEFRLNGETLRYVWYGTGIDPAEKQEVQRSRIEWLTGKRTGEVVEHDHVMAIWDWDSWSQLIRSAGFRQVSALDTSNGFRELQVGPQLHEHPQSWHFLMVD